MGGQFSATALSRLGCAGWLVLLCSGQDILSQDSVSHRRAIDALRGEKVRHHSSLYLPQYVRQNGKDEASKVRHIQG
jgi:hypothetical protein